MKQSQERRRKRLEKEGNARIHGKEIYFFKDIFKGRFKKHFTELKK
jgi:hypothetical protein